MRYISVTWTHTIRASMYGDGIFKAPYARFNSTGANIVVYALCCSALSLNAGVDPLVKTYTDATGVEVLAQVSWAFSQSGCLTEQTVPPSGDSCLDALNLTLEKCDLEIQFMHRGGAYILNGAGGRVEYLLYGEKACTSDSLS
ncbi:hypothetical protein BDZ45DRAFT_750091 [Acephala macrosclerotiorum]|nr:hypothetical protein BDZ45DRAFT_750091 [Acephala macrosclerotiorum]